MRISKSAVQAIAAAAVLGMMSGASCLAQAKLSSGASSTVVYVGGDDLVVKTADGKLLNYSVASGTKFMVGDKAETLAELKPGVVLTRELSTGFDPRLVSAVQVTKGKVFQVTPPDGVTLSLSDGIHELTVPAGTVFEVAGKSLSINELKPDMMVEATIVTTMPDGATVAGATPAAPPKMGALLVSKTAGEGDLPAAGTQLPLYGVLGVCLLAVGIGLMSLRRARPV